jgi:hypothetical protein
MRNVKYLLIIFFYYSSVSLACDLCALHTPIEKNATDAGNLTLSIAEQFTEFSKLQKESKSVENTNNQHLNSSITQLSGVYQFDDRFSLQTILPYIHRSYKRVSSLGMEDGTVSGIGDLSLLVRYAPIRIQDDNKLFVLNVFSGIKLPTGDTDRLNDSGHQHTEEHLEEDDHDNHTESHEEHETNHSSDHSNHLHSFRHGGIDHSDEEDYSNISAIHGHDLTLGTGSVDVPVGLNLQYIEGRKVIIANAIYNFRTEGDYDYRVADDLMYNAILAYKLTNNDEYNFSAGLNLSGQYKKKDKADGKLDNDTGIRSFFMGPAIVLNSDNAVSADLSLDIPMDINNTGFQAVADYRIRAGLNYNF